MTACAINASHLLDIQHAKSAFLQYIAQYPELAVSALYSGMLLTQKWLTHPQTLSQYHEHYTKFTHTL